MLVKTSDFHVRGMDQQQSTIKTKLGKWYNTDRNKSHTTARGDHMLVMKAITAILYNGNRLHKLGPNKKIRLKKMISELVVA
jgi:hypothetical protein